MTSTTIRIIDQKIAELEADIRALKVTRDLLLGVHDDARPARRWGRRRGTVETLIMDCLQSAGGRPKHVNDILAYITAQGMSMRRRALVVNLSRYYTSGKVHRVGTSLYTARPRLVPMAQ